MLFYLKQFLHFGIIITILMAGACNPSNQTTNISGCSYRDIDGICVYDFGDMLIGQKSEAVLSIQFGADFLSFESIWLESDKEGIYIEPTKLDIEDSGEDQKVKLIYVPFKPGSTSVSLFAKKGGLNEAKIHIATIKAVAKFAGIKELRVYSPCRWYLAKPNTTSYCDLVVQNTGQEPLTINDIFTVPYYNEGIFDIVNRPHGIIELHQNELLTLRISASPTQYINYGSYLVFIGESRREKYVAELECIARDSALPIARVARVDDVEVEGVPNYFRPSSTLRLSALDSEGSLFSSGQLMYRWTLSEKPYASGVQLWRADTPETILGANFDGLDVPGVYVIMLKVTDELGFENESKLVVNNLPEENLYIYLKHDNDLALLDLHLAKGAKFFTEDDCTGADCLFPGVPNWGGEEQNPSLDTRNDLNAQVIRVKEPQYGVYGVGVSYEMLRGNNASANATLYVFSMGGLVAQFSRQIWQVGSFWYIANIYWPPSRIESIDQMEAPNKAL